jgi:hypothetical protein
MLVLPWALMLAMTVWLNVGAAMDDDDVGVGVASSFGSGKGLVQCGQKNLMQANFLTASEKLNESIRGCKIGSLRTNVPDIIHARHDT